jgi:transcriptional regulator with XRE-family HTH domain
MNEFGYRIRILRNILKMEQNKFAANIGLQSANLSSIEMGKSQPSASIIKTIIENYKVSPDYFYKDNFVIYFENGLFRVDAELSRKISVLENEIENKIAKLDSCEQKLRLSEKIISALEDQLEVYKGKKKHVG